MVRVWCRMPGPRLLRNLAEQTTLTRQLSGVLRALSRPRTRHDPGRVFTDLAVAIADGAECISDIATLADQPALGPLPSDTTVWRLLEQLDSTSLEQIAMARAAVRETAWAQRAENIGVAFPPSVTAGREVEELRVDLDASVVIAHSEKGQAAATFNSPGSTPVIGPTLESRTASDAPKTPAWAGSRPASPASTKPG